MIRDLMEFCERIFPLLTILGGVKLIDLLVLPWVTVMFLFSSVLYALEINYELLI
jgi:hypothetical protein